MVPATEAAPSVRGFDVDRTLHPGLVRRPKLVQDGTRPLGSQGLAFGDGPALVEEFGKRRVDFAGRAHGIECNAAADAIQSIEDIG